MFFSFISIFLFSISFVLVSPSFKCQFHLERFGNHLGCWDVRLKGLHLETAPKIHTLGCPPSQDSSHHQDYEPFLVGDPNLNLHLPQLLGGGTTQSIRILAAAGKFTKKDSLFGNGRHDSLSLHFYPAIPAKTRPNFFVQRQLLSKIHFSKLTLTTYKTQWVTFCFLFSTSRYGFWVVGSGYNGGPVVASYISPRFQHFTNLYCKSNSSTHNSCQFLAPAVLQASISYNKNQLDAFF